MVYTEGETSDSQTDTKKRRRSSAGLAGEDKKRKKISPTQRKKMATNTQKNTDYVDKYGEKENHEDLSEGSHNWNTGHNVSGRYPQNHTNARQSLSEGGILATTCDLNNSRSNGLNPSENKDVVHDQNSQPKLKEVIVNLMDTLKDVYGEEIIRFSEEECDVRFTVPDVSPCGSGDRDEADAESLLGDIIEKARFITAGLMENLHNTSNNNRSEAYLKNGRQQVHHIQTENDTQSDSNISSISFDYAIGNDTAMKDRHSVKIPTHEGSVSVQPSGSYMDVNNNVTPVQNDDRHGSLSKSESAEFTKKMSDLDINQPQSLGFFKLLDFLAEDGGVSELSSDNLSYLSTLMTQREEKTHETEAHSHQQAEGPRITHRDQGRQQAEGQHVTHSGRSTMDEAEWQKVKEKQSSKSCPLDVSLPKLAGTGKLFPHKSSLSMLTPKQKPSIPPTHRGNFILAGKPAEDRGNSYWRQFRSPEPLRHNTQHAENNQSGQGNERSFAGEYIKHTLPQLLQTRQDMSVKDWPKQISKDSLVKNKIYDYYFRLIPGSQRPYENPTLKIKDIQFGQKMPDKQDASQEEQIKMDAGQKESLKLDARSVTSDQSSTNLNCPRPDPCPSLVSAIQPSIATTTHRSVPSTSSRGESSSIKRMNRRIETAKDAVLNSLYQKNTMNRHNFWRQSHPLLHGTSLYSDKIEQMNARKYSVYQLGSLRSTNLSRSEDRGADSRLSGPLMGKILEGYDQSCGTKSEQRHKLNEKKGPMSLADSFRKDLAQKQGRNYSQKINESRVDNNSKGSSQKMRSQSCKMKVEHSPEWAQDRLTIGSSFLKQDNNKQRRDYLLSKQRQTEEQRRKQEILRLRFAKGKNLGEKTYNPVYKLSDRDPYSDSTFDYKRVSRNEVKNIDSRAVSPKIDVNNSCGETIKETISGNNNEETIQEIQVQVKHIKKKLGGTGKAVERALSPKKEGVKTLPAIQKAEERNVPLSSTPHESAGKGRSYSLSQLNKNSNNQYSFPSGNQHSFVRSDGTLDAQRSRQNCFFAGNLQQPHHQSATYVHSSDGHSDVEGRRYLPTAADILHFADRNHPDFHQYNISRQAAGGCSNAISCFWDVTTKLQDKNHQETKPIEDTSKTLQQQYDLVGQVLQDSAKQIVMESHRSGSSSDKSGNSKVPCMKSNSEQVKPVEIKVPQWKNEKFYKEWVMQKELAKFNKIPQSKITNIQPFQNRTGQFSKSLPDAKLYAMPYDATKYSPQSDTNGTTTCSKLQEQEARAEDHLQSNGHKVYPKDRWINPTVESRAHVTETLKKMLVQKVYEEHTGKLYPTARYAKPDSCNNTRTEPENQGGVPQKTEEIQVDSNKKQIYIHDDDGYYQPGTNVPIDLVKTGPVGDDGTKSNEDGGGLTNGLKSILRNKTESKGRTKGRTQRGESESKKVGSKKTAAQSGSEGSVNSDHTLGGITQHTTSPVRGSSLRSLNKSTTEEKVAYKSYGDSSDKNKSDCYHSNSRSQKVKESSFTRVKTAERKSSGKKKRDLREDEILRKESALKRESDLVRCNYKTVNEGKQGNSESRGVEDVEIIKVATQPENKPILKDNSKCDDIKVSPDKLKLEGLQRNSRFCPNSDVSSRFSDSDWSVSSHRSFITQMFDDSDSDDEDLLKPAFYYEDPPIEPCTVKKEKSDLFNEKPNGENNTMDGDCVNGRDDQEEALESDKRPVKNLDQNRRRDGNIEAEDSIKNSAHGIRRGRKHNTAGHSKERMKTNSSKNIHKADKSKQRDVVTKTKCGRKLENTNNNTQKTSGSEKERKNSADETDGQYQEEHREHTGVQSFKDYLQKKIKSKTNLPSSERSGSPLDGTLTTKQSSQEVFKSVWARTRGNETPYVVNPWKPRKESSKIRKSFDRNKYSYLLDPSMGECTTEDDLNELCSAGQGYSELEDDTKGKLLDYDGKCIVSLTSPGHDDVHITITLPVARKSQRRKSSGSHRTRTRKTCSSNEKVQAVKALQESEISSTEKSDDALVKKIGNHKGVKKRWSGKKDRSKLVAELDSFQSLTSSERERTQTSDAVKPEVSDSSSEDSDSRHQIASQRRPRKTSVGKRQAGSESRAMQALAREQAKIYSIITNKGSSKTHGLHMTQRQGGSSSRGCTSVRRLEPEGRTSSEESAEASSSHRYLSDSSAGATVDSKENPETALRDVCETKPLDSSGRGSSPKALENIHSWISTHGENSAGTKYIDEVEYSITHYQTQRCFDRVTLESQCGYINLQTLKLWLPYVEDNGFLYIPVREITALFRECFGRCNIRKSTILRDGQLDVRMCSHQQANLYGNIWPIGKKSSNIHSGDMMVRWDRFCQHYRRLRKKIIEQHRNTTKRWSRECLYNLK